MELLEEDAIESTLTCTAPSCGHCCASVPQCLFVLVDEIRFEKPTMTGFRSAEKSYFAVFKGCFNLPLKKKNILKSIEPQKILIYFYFNMFLKEKEKTEFCHIEKKCPS